MLEFIKAQPDVVPKLLLHMSTSSIMDLLLKIISMEEAPEGRGTVEVQESWRKQKLLSLWTKSLTHQRFFFVSWNSGSADRD